MENLMTTNLLCWYNVDFPKISEIEIRIIPGAMVWLENFVAGHRLVDSYIEGFQFQSFTPFSNGCCGFNDILKMKAENDQVLFTGKLPKDLMLPPSSGPKYELLEPLLASFDLIFRGLRLYESRVDEMGLQKYLVNYFSPSKTSRGNCLGVIISKYVVSKIVEKFGTTGFFSFKKKKKRMARFYRRLTGWSDYLACDFRCSINDSRLMVACPGNACDLMPELSYVIDGQGYEMTPHNLDNPVQLITLFFGVAEFCRLIDRL